MAAMADILPNAIGNMEGGNQNLPNGICACLGQIFDPKPDFSWKWRALCGIQYKADPLFWPRKIRLQDLMENAECGVKSCLKCPASPKILVIP